jgi:hypothetical protein
VPRLSAAAQAHDAVPPTRELMAPWAFVTPMVLMTKAGHLALAYEMGGRDAQGLTRAQRAHVAMQAAQGFRRLDERLRAYQYLVKTAADPLTVPQSAVPALQPLVADRVADLNARGAALFDVRRYLVLVLEGGIATRVGAGVEEWLAHPLAATQRWFSPRAVAAHLAENQAKGIAALEQAGASLVAHLRDVVPLRPLAQEEWFQLLYRLVNYTPNPGFRCPARSHLDYHMSQSRPKVYDDVMQVGKRWVKVLTAKEMPASTYAHMLESLYTVRGTFVAAIEWNRVENDRLRKVLKRTARHYHQKRISLVNYVSEQTHVEEMLIDQSAGALVQEVHDAATELELHNNVFGWMSLSLVLHADTEDAVEELAHSVAKELAAHDGSLTTESHHILSGWAAIVPGNAAMNVRRRLMTLHNLADLSFLFALNQGDRDRAVAVFETPEGALFHYDPFVDDVGHTAVFGRTGVGKSVAVNFILTGVQAAGGRAIVCDMGHSYRRRAARLHQGYLQLGLSSGLRINPFALAPTPENLHFVHGFCRVLLESHGEQGKRPGLSAEGDRRLYQAVLDVYKIPTPERRRLTRLSGLLPRDLQDRLSPWVGDGRYASLFDHAVDDLNEAAVFEFGAMKDFPELLEPMLFYILHRISGWMEAPGMGVCVLDEAWRWIQHPVIRDYVITALKTWRKFQAAMILATQQAEDFTDRALLRSIVENCPTKLFLANPGLDREFYEKVFGLNVAELDLLVKVKARRQLLLKRDDVVKVLELQLGDDALWTYTAEPQADGSASLNALNEKETTICTA